MKSFKSGFGLAEVATYLSVFVFCSAFLGMCEGPGSDSTPQISRYFVFVTNSTDNTVSSFVEDVGTGGLTSAGAPVTVGAGPGPIAVHPGGRFLYVVNQTDATIQALSINPTTGLLTAVGSAIASGTRSVTVDPSGRFAYTVEYGPSPTARVHMYSINSGSGVLTASTPSSIAITATGSYGPLNLAVNPTSTFAYVSNNHDNRIEVFAINSTTGVLTASSTLSPASVNPAGPDFVTGLTMDSAGQFLYGTNNQTPGGIDTYTINSSTGALTHANFIADSGSSGLGGLGPSAGVLSPGGTCLYAAGGNVLAVYGFSVNSTTGTLTAAPGSPYTGPSKLPVVDAESKHVYVVGPNNNLSVYDMNSVTCALTPASPATVSTGTAPFGVAVVKITQ